MWYIDIRSGGVAAALVSVALIRPVDVVRGDPQDPGKPVFDVVSVKARGPLQDIPLAGGRWGHNRTPFKYAGRRVTAIQTLTLIIQEAYSLSDWEIDGPAWMKSFIYEIQAEMPPNTNRAAARLMLQSMLADRFDLKCHRESRKMPQYLLVVGKKGFKLHEEIEPGRSETRMRSGEFVSTGSLDTMAAVFTNYADLPVINTTAIPGVYHIDMRWDPDEPGNLSRHYDPGFWMELERVAGLKVEKRSLPTSVLVIDHAERVPTGN